MPPRREQLAARRQALGYSQETLSEAIGVAVESVARWERGQTKPRAMHRSPLADRLQVTLPELERILNGHEQPALNGHAVPAWLSHYASLEQGAARFQTVEPISIPGLLQTEQYATAMMQNYYRPASANDIADRVQARLARQAVLDREPDPLELHCVIDESVLNRETGSSAVMADQLDHLVSVAGRPTVLVQIVPAGGGALHCTWFGSFSLFTSAGSSKPFMACTEDLGGIHYQDSPHVIEAHAELFEHLTTIALPPEQSAELIKTRAEKYR